MNLDHFFDGEYLVKAWDGCGPSSLFGKDILAISRHEHFLIRISVDTRTHDDTQFDLGLLEDIISTEIDDIIEDSEYLGRSVPDMVWDLTEHRDYKSLLSRLEFMGLQMTLIENKVIFDHEENRELMEVQCAYSGLKFQRY